MTSCKSQFYIKVPGNPRGFVTCPQACDLSPRSVCGKIENHPRDSRLTISTKAIVRRASLLGVLLACAGCSASYTIGGTVSGLTGAGLVLQNNGRDDLSIVANGPFTFTTKSVDRAPYDVTVLTQPSGQACSVANGSGRVSGSNVTNVSVSCSNAVRALYAYVANFSDNSVSSYASDVSTGRLKYLGKAATGTNPQSVTVDPSGKYVYVANNAGSTVSQYTIGTNGALAAMPVPAVASGLFPFSVTVDPSGRYAYVANGGDNNL